MRFPQRPIPAPSSDNAEERDLFVREIGSVRPIKAHAALPAKRRPAPEPKQSLADEARVPHESLHSIFDPALIEIGEELSYVKQNQSPHLLRRLKRGDFSIVDEIDLHEMIASVARDAINEFLGNAKRERRLCVKIIHGKGLRSRENGPVLKRLVDAMLRRRADVLAFASAKPNNGGTGAVIVLLDSK